MSWRRNLWVLVLAVTLGSSSYTMVVPFLPLYLLEIGADPKHVNIWAGIVFSVSFLVGAIMAPYWGRCSDNDGKRRMVLRAGFSLAAVYFLGSLVRNPVELLLVRILQGFANGYLPASMAVVAASVPEDKLGFSLGLVQTASLLGSIMGPIVGGTLSHIFGMRLSFVIAALGIFIGTIAVKVLVVEPEKNGCPAHKGSIIADMKLALSNKSLVEMLFLLFGVQVVSLMLQPLITLYVAELQGTMEGAVLTAGIVCSLAGVAGAIAAPLWGRVGQRKGFVKILIIAFIGASLFNMGQFFAVDIYQFSLLQFLYGLFVVGVYPAVNTIAVTSVDANYQGRILGLTTTANQLGSMVGPLVGGVISSLVGIKPVFFVTGSLLFASGLIAFSIFLRDNAAVKSMN